MTNRLDRKSVVEFLSATLPTYDELFSLMEKSSGWLPVNPEVLDLLLKLETPWCTYYEDENKIKALAYYFVFDGEDESKENISTILNETTEFLNLSDSEVDKLKAQNERSQPDFDTLSSQEKEESARLNTVLIYALITHLFNYLALMIHRRTMCQLVAIAENGDDEAFRQAVHIDRTVLQLPYFQKRLLRAQFSNDGAFLNKLAASLRTPILQSKIRYRTLMLAFAMLDDANILDDLTHEQLFDICEEIGIAGEEHGLSDVGYLSKRLKEYRTASRH